MWLGHSVLAMAQRRHGFVDPWIKKIPWRRKWQPTPVFLTGKSHEQRAQVGYSPWGHKELDTANSLIHTQIVWGFPGGASGKEPASQRRR